MLAYKLLQYYYRSICYFYSSIPRNSRNLPKTTTFLALFQHNKRNSAQFSLRPVNNFEPSFATIASWEGLRMLRFDLGGSQQQQQQQQQPQPPKTPSAFRYGRAPVVTVSDARVAYFEKTDQNKIGSSSKLITSWFQENDIRKLAGSKGPKNGKNNTLPKTNIGHNSWTMLGDYFPFGKALLFRGEMFALGGVNTTWRQLKLSLSNQVFSHANLVVCKAWNSLNHSTTLPETNSSHLKEGPSRKEISSPSHPFSGMCFCCLFQGV